MMKKIFLVASLMVLTLAAFAQPEKGTLTLQPKVGVNVAYFTGSDGVDTKPRFGLVIGSELAYQFGECISLSGGIFYSQQGEKAKMETRDIGRVNIIARTDYVSLPFLASFYVTKGFALKFGAQPAFNVNGSYYASTLYGARRGDLSSLGIYVNTFDFSIPVGLSYEYKNFIMDARYDIGITKLAKYGDSRHRAFQIMVGFKREL